MLFNQYNNRALRNALLTTSAAAAVLIFGSSISWAQDSNTTTTAPNGTSKDASKTSSTVSEVVVTGTNIKGVKPIAPVITITRQDIDESGYATIGDVMRSLPEDFAGGQNPGITTASGANNANVSNASTVDLFGLGSDATLTLIDGHRLPGDSLYQGADISVIPLGAIQRVEVVTDGSSAIYGSDAVAGVVNFILRKDYNGLEASAYYGGTTDGGGEDQIYSVLGGVARDRYHLLASAEYEREEPITASERGFTSDAYGPTTLIEPQTRKTVFVSGGVDITDKISFSLDGLYNDRESGAVYGVTGGYNEHTQFDSPNANVAATLDFKLPRGWDLSLVGTDAVSENAGGYREVITNTLIKDAYNYFNRVSSAEVAATGKVITLPTGDLRTALGVGYREEGFKNDYPGNAALNIDVIHASRSVAYAYGEAQVPLVPASADRLGLEELEVNASGRFEHYSDFGDTANPKVGIRYVPFGGLSLRGTWGTSFKAPSFDQMYQLREVAYVPGSYFSYPGNALEVLDGNPNLKPERSKNWTIGVEYSPPEIPSLVLSVTYFNIDYMDRIVEPLSNASFTTLATDPAYASFVTADPSASVVQSTVAGAGDFVNAVGTTYNASTVDLIVDRGYVNAEAQVDHGVDISYRQSFVLGIGDLRTFANATWNHLTQQLSATEPVETISGTIFNVPTFKARGGASWSKSGLTATAIMNYTSPETNTVVTPKQTIGSWTTVDVNLAYKFSDSAGLLHGLAFTLSATNLFDRAPPYAKTPDPGDPGLNFDSLNASPIGRFVAFKVTKKF